MTADINTLLYFVETHRREITKEDADILLKVGNLYHRTPQDVQESVAAIVHSWTSKKLDESVIENSPIGRMYHSLRTQYNFTNEEAYGMCDLFLKHKVYLIVASV